MEIRFLLEHEGWLDDIDITVEGAVDIAMGQVFSMIHDELRNRTPVDVTTAQGKAKPFGAHLQENWKLQLLDVGNRKGQNAQITTDIDYAPILEYGKYPYAGKRTKAGQDGIYSKQAVGGMIRPLINDPDILGDAINTIVVKLDEKMDQLVTRK